MGDKIIIKLGEGIDAAEFYGVNNSNINYIKSKCASLNIAVRGVTITAKGATEDLKSFDTKINKLIVYIQKYKHISTKVIDQVFDAIQLTAPNSSMSGQEREQSEKDYILHSTTGIAIRARGENQLKIVEQCAENDLLFAIGPAGSGKTYIAIALAVKALKERRVKRIILTRPAVEAGEKLGYLPGDMKEKLDPYLQPLYDALRDMVPQKKLEQYIEEGVIQIAPLAYMRGRTLDNAFVILDEAQNTTMSQIKMFLTRMGRNAKFVVTGDTSQIDLPHRSMSGLAETVDFLKDIKGVACIMMQSKDIVRHKLVKDIVEAFDKHFNE